MAQLTGGERAVGTHTRGSEQGVEDGVEGSLASEWSQAHTWGGKAFHAGDSVPGSLEAGLGWKVLKARGQATLWVPGTPCSAAGGSDIGAVPLLPTV